MKMKIELIKKTVMFVVISVFAVTILSSWLVSADTQIKNCSRVLPNLPTDCNPTLINDLGTSVTIHGSFTVNANNYPDNSTFVTYNMQVHNPNDRKIIFTVQPDPNIQSYVAAPTIAVSPFSVASFPIQVWVGSSGIIGGLTYVYNFSDGSSPFCKNCYGATINIIGNGNFGSPSPPSNSCSLPPSSCDNTTGIYNLNTCFLGNPYSMSFCTKTCCKGFGGTNAFCSSDGFRCISPYNIGSGTKGNIALACSKGDCSGTADQKVQFMLQFNGWNVTGKGYKTWTESDLSNYDIIVCTDEATACDMKFNSPLYNAHFIDSVPVLEMPSTPSDKAAYDFGYTSSISAALVRNDTMIYNGDSLTGTILSPDIPVAGVQFAGVAGKNINNGTIAVANSSDNNNVVIFKVNDTVDHGRYVYFGLYTKSLLEDTNPNGMTLLANTLQWLTSGNRHPVRIEKIAFICSNSLCTIPTDIAFVKYLRQNGFYVVADSLSNWQNANLNGYHVLLCDSVSACNIKKNSNIYNATMLSGKSFVEITQNSRLQAAYVFGFVPTASGKVKTSNSITLAGGPLGSGPLTVDIKTRSMAVYNITSLHSATSIANALYFGVDQGVSTMFYVSGSGTTHGTYMFIGWTGSLDLKALTSDGKSLLLSALKWIN